MVSFRRFGAGLIGIMLLATALAACGETATPVPATSAAAVATTTNAAAATTVVAATSAATSAAIATTTNAVVATTTTIATTTATSVAMTTNAPMTTDAATSVVITTNATTVASTPAVNNGGGSNGTFTNNVAVPSISGLDEIQLSQPILDYFQQTTGAAMSKSSSAVKFLGFKYYGSNDDIATVANNVDKALTGAGYKYVSLGGGDDTSISKGKITSFGLYTKDGNPDLVISMADPKNTASINSQLTPAPGKTLPAGMQDLINQLKSKKTVVVVIAATGYAQLFSGAMATATAGAHK